jgi:hypothetical protein
MRMNFAMARIYHQPLKIRLINQHFQQTFPHTAITPPNKPAVSIAPSAEVRREVSPRSASAHNPKNSIYKIPIILRNAAPTSFAAGQMRLYLCPCFIRNIVPPMCEVGHKVSLLVEVRASMPQI